MTKPHKHAELIKAWADGAEIEFKWLTGGEDVNGWHPISTPSWHCEKYEFRVKQKANAMPENRHFPTWTNDNLVKFAQEASDKLKDLEKEKKGGISLLDHFAGCMLTGVSANTNYDLSANDYAKVAYNVAEAMMEERERVRRKTIRDAKQERTK